MLRVRSFASHRAVGGSVSLIGGHGTAIAWAPNIATQFNLDNAMEVGVACATFGLILASVVGGPMAKHLINANKLTLPQQASEESKGDVIAADQQINAYDFLEAVFAIHMCIILGYVLNNVLLELGLALPLFVTCLMAGIIFTNAFPKHFFKIFSGAGQASLLQWH